MPKHSHPPTNKKETATRVNKPHRKNTAAQTAVTNPTHSLQRAYQNPDALTSADAQTLQRTIGNQALGRLLIQRKMTVGPVGDKYEQEADTVAKQVVSKLQATSTQTAPTKTAQRQEEEDLQMKPLIQRQEEEELQMKPLPIISSLQRQEEEELQMKPLVQRQEEDELQMKSIQRQEEEELQAKSETTKGDPMLAGGELSGDVESSVQSAKSGGQPMSDTIRGPMEQAFGADFSGVKIHADSQANTLNRSLSARAFTSGQDVFFRSGEYNPDNSSGKELLAHELTHVVQQNNTAIRRKGIEPGDDLPEMQSMTANHLNSQLDLGTEKTARSDAIANYMTLHELGDAQANIQNIFFMVSTFNTFVEGQGKTHEDFSETFVTDFVAIAEPLLGTAATMQDAKKAVLKGVAHLGSDTIRFGAQFFTRTGDNTARKAKEAAPEARDENVLAAAFLEGREDVEITDQITTKEETNAFAAALKKMVTVQLLLNPPKKGISGLGHGWKGGGSVADEGNIVTEPPEGTNSEVKTDILNGKFSSNVEAANNFIKFIIEPQLLREIDKPEIHVHLDYSSGFRHPKGFRAFQSGKTVHVAQNEDTAIIVHEIGHYLEAKLPPETWHDIRLLIEERHKAKGGGATAGQGAGGKKDKEGRHEGDYAATGKYTSRTYASGDTEMMSMTLEYLANKTNAKKMVEKDPQQAAIILRGVRPREYAQTNELRPFDKYLPQ